MELPSLATRTWFHALGDTVVGGSELFEIRARQGEVTFVPGVRDASGSVQAGEALRFRTVRIGRDGAADNVAPAQEAVGGALQIRHQAATERWVNRLDAAEQSFVFPQALPGDGDLVVEIATTGLECAESTTAGLRFVADDGLSGVLYGHGTFIDAAGRATPVPAVCSERGISLRVPADVAEDASYPAVLDPLVSPSFPLTPPIPESANGDLPSVACSDTVCMMVFVDSRDGTYRRYAGRFTPDGTILDQTPPVLGGVQAVQQGQASVAHVADRFFVAYRDGSTVFGQLIGENGALLSPPITVATGAATTDRPRVGCDAAGCLVTWLQGADLLVANRVALDGTVLDGAGFVVASPASATCRAPVKLTPSRP